MREDVLRASLRCRRQILDLKARRILVARIAGSSQQEDLTRPPNCGGYGRIRHFDRDEGADWPEDPLPNDPTCKALGISENRLVKAQVFQCARCNCRCWYCFVPSELLRADPDWFQSGRYGWRAPSASAG